MAANPFLFSEETYTSPNSSASNPFLMGDDDDATSQSDNPFLSQTATAISTNPFSFDPMELEPAEAEIPKNSTATDPFGSFPNENLTGTHDSPFGTPEPANTEPILPNKIEATSMSPQKPADLNLKYTNAGFNNLPPRPPPPRPPPSKETQDLLMSVMGAMDATSSTLLDKIPPTRTPSPVSMRDLHSPCPTPEPPFGDLLDVGDKPEVTNTNFTSNDKDLFTLEQDNICDINQNPAVNLTDKNSKPPRPTPPARPPKPPLPPALLNNIPKEPTVNNSTSAQAPAQQNTNNVNIVDEMDMFGIEDRPQKPVTKADILNLYNTPKQETVKDLLCDTDETDLIVQNNQTLSTVSQPVEESNKTEIPAPDMLTDSFSPEAHQDDLKMDLSESHSKESVSTTVNPFATSEDVTPQQPVVSQELFESEMETMNQEKAMDIFNTTVDDTKSSVFAQELPKPTEPLNQDAFVAPAEIPVEDAFGITSDSAPIVQDAFGATNAAGGAPVVEDPFGFSGGTSTKSDDFDEFSKKFDSVKTDASKFGDAWGNEVSGTGDVSSGFGQEEGFDAFLALQEPPCVPQSTPNKVSKAPSQESDEDKDFSVFIRPKGTDECESGILPTIAPPPVPQQAAFVDTSPRFNPFDNQTDVSNAFMENDTPFSGEMTRTDSQETPPTPLFDDDVSQPLEPFPRTIYTGEGWEMHLRQPNKKKITGQRFWKKIFVRLLHQTDCVLLQLFSQKDDKDPFQELPLQPCYSVSEIGAQQYDQFGKIFTVKLQYIFYKERPGVRPGQVKKAERITNKLSQFAAYAIQGDYQGVKEFGSDLKKLGLPVEHAPQVSQLMKLGSLNFEDLKQFSMCIEEALFRLQAHRDRALHYKMEEVQITAVDELYVEQDAEGHVDKQIARVRLFFLGFLTGMPDVELGVNDMRRQGKEVVGRHDIIPVVTEEWIRLENVEFHSCIQQEDYNNTHIIKFKPPDACYIELMRFRVRPPKNRELPLQLKAQICITGYKVELRADVLVPGFTSRKLGQVPCEDVMIRFPIPECWIYLFRVEKHFRYGSVKSAHRRTGKVKGIERILGAMETLQENLIEVTSGQAKYEHQHRAIVWRCPRLPKEGQGAYTTHNMVCRIALTNFDQMPEKLAEYCYVEFTMPATQVSHTTCRSVSMQNSESDEPPEKYVRYLARHEYRVGIERTQGESPNAYSAATFVTKSAPPPPPAAESTPKVVEESSSDSD